MNKNTTYGFMLLLGAAMAFTACGQKREEKSTTEASSVPLKVEFQKPTPGTRLTPAQVEIIRETFKGRQTMVLPPGKLIFPSKKAKPEALEAAEAKLKSEDENSYALLKEIQNGCKKTERKQDITTKIPLDDKKLPKELRVGDTAAYSLESLIAGDHCPVDSSLKVKGNGNFKQVEPNGLSGTAEFVAGGKFNGLINDQKYTKLLNSRGLLVETTVNGLSSQRDTAGRTYYEAKTSGTYMTLEKEIGFTANTKYAGHIITLNTTLGIPDVVQETTLNFKDFSATMIVHSYPFENGLKTEGFLNGFPMTDKDYQDLFGKNTPQALQEKAGLSAKTIK